MAAVAEMGGEAASANNQKLDSISKPVSESKPKSEFDVQKLVDMFTKLNPLAKEFFPSSYSPLHNHNFDNSFAVNNNMLLPTDNQANNRRVLIFLYWSPFFVLYFVLFRFFIYGFVANCVCL